LPQAKRIRQGYIFVDERGELRIRDTDNQYTMAVKGKDGVGGILRREFDRPIPAWVFEHIWAATAGRRIFKDRYPIPYRNHLLELDIYHDRNQGHIKLECEFQPNEDPDDFTLPNWAADAREVTDDSRYNDKSVALHGAPIK
jgi:CYTH domain-containing protein